MFEENYKSNNYVWNSVPTYAGFLRKRFKVGFPIRKISKIFGNCMKYSRSVERKMTLQWIKRDLLADCTKFEPSKFTPEILFFTWRKWVSMNLNFTHCKLYYPVRRAAQGIKKMYILSVSSSFCQHRYFSYSLHGMTMWLRYIHELDDCYKSYGSKNSPGVIWGHWGQKG